MLNYNFYIERSNKERIVIVGGGFGGLRLAKDLSDKNNYQIVLIDKYNYHQFQPLLYQVATAGLDAASISFPLRKIFQGKKNFHIRLAEVTSINPLENQIKTSIGDLDYDHLILAIGTQTNYFGNQNIQKNAISMKKVTEALSLRNRILQNYEDSLSTQDALVREELMNIVVVGGGPTGVEIAGALAEMKKILLPKDFPELDFSGMKIFLLEGTSKLLGNMSEYSSKKAVSCLQKLGVDVMLNSLVKDFDGKKLYLTDGRILNSQNIIWAAGVTANKIDGIPDNVIHKGNRILVNEFNQIKGFSNIYALGDLALMDNDKNYPSGHPQLATVAIQQAKKLAKNLNTLAYNKQKRDINKSINNNFKPFRYKNIGSMATIGRNLAVVDLYKPRLSLGGFWAWIIWMSVHLLSLIGIKNKLVVLLNWIWGYVTYDQSLRLIIKEEKKDCN